jgi:hypothetical protein
VATFLMADGSVRFIRDAVGREILHALATPGGGEDVELPIDARDVGAGVSDTPVGPRKTAAQRAAGRRP